MRLRASDWAVVALCQVASVILRQLVAAQYDILSYNLREAYEYISFTTTVIAHSPLQSCCFADDALPPMHPGL